MLCLGFRTAVRARVLTGTLPHYLLTLALMCPSQTGKWVDMPNVTAQIKGINQDELKKINIDRETTAIRLYNKSAGYLALGFLQVFKRI